MSFKIGDRVISRGLYSRMFGIGKIIDIQRNVAIVLFDNNQATEGFHIAMLKKQ